jgi:hypothetical protein
MRCRLRIRDSALGRGCYNEIEETKFLNISENTTSASKDFKINLTGEIALLVKFVRYFTNEDPPDSIHAQFHRASEPWIS